MLIIPPPPFRKRRARKERQPTAPAAVCTIISVTDNGDATYDVEFSEPVTMRASPGDYEIAFLCGPDGAMFDPVFYVAQNNATTIQYNGDVYGNAHWLSVFPQSGFTVNSGNPFSWSNVDTIVHTD